MFFIDWKLTRWKLICGNFFMAFISMWNWKFFSIQAISQRFDDNLYICIIFNEFASKKQRKPSLMRMFLIKNVQNKDQKVKNPNYPSTKTILVPAQLNCVHLFWLHILRFISSLTRARLFNVLTFLL